jgi:hypothetical protein
VRLGDAASVSRTLVHVNLWVPDRADSDALGDLPEHVTLELIPSDGEPPQAILDAEFLVPGQESPRVLTEALLELLHAGRLSAARFAFVGEQVRRYVRGEPLTNVVEQGY